jgi:hypothetical protein
LLVFQVRKTSQAALLVLLEQGLVEKSDVREQVCPVIIRLTEADSLDDYRTEAVAVSGSPKPDAGLPDGVCIFRRNLGTFWSAFQCKML